MGLSSTILGTHVYCCCFPVKTTKTGIHSQQTHTHTQHAPPPPPPPPPPPHPEKVRPPRPSALHLCPGPRLEGCGQLLSWFRFWRVAIPRSPRCQLSHRFFIGAEGSPTKIGYRKKDRVPLYSNLSTGGPRFCFRTLTSPRSVELTLLIVNRLPPANLVDHWETEHLLLFREAAATYQLGRISKYVFVVGLKGETEHLRFSRVLRQTHVGCLHLFWLLGLNQQANRLNTYPQHPELVRTYWCKDPVLSTVTILTNSCHLVRKRWIKGANFQGSQVDFA